MKIKPFLLFAICVTILASCKKEDGTTSDPFLNKIWKRGLTDKNPSTNPQGRIIYHAVLDCEKDDIYQFESDGSLIINRGTEECTDDGQTKDTVSYLLDKKAMKLSINGTEYRLAELSKDQIKYYAPLPFASDADYIVFLLQ